MIRGFLTIFIHTDCPETFLDSFPDFLRRHTEVLRPESDVLFHNLPDNLVIRILENHPRFLTDFPQIIVIGRIHSVDCDRSLGRIKKCIDVLCKRRFSGSVVAENRDKLPRLHVHIYIVKCAHFSDDISFIVFLQIVMGEFLRKNHVRTYQ